MQLPDFGDFPVGHRAAMPPPLEGRAADVQRVILLCASRPLVTTIGLGMGRRELAETTGAGISGTATCCDSTAACEVNKILGPKAD